LIKIKKQLRTIPASAEEQSLKFSIKVHFALLLIAYNCSFQLCEHKQKLHTAY